MLLERSTGQWTFGSVSSSDTDPAWLGNAILGVKRISHYVLIETHLSPSALQTIVLGRNLRLVRRLYGWSLAELPDESIVYRHSMIHFAPTHPVEISLFNPNSLQEKQIYPPSPDQPIRTEFIRRVAQVYRALGEDWFRINNYPSEPKDFDSGTSREEMVAESSTKSIAFKVRFGDADVGSISPINFNEQVVVTCTPTKRINQTQCRERRLSDWRKALNLPQASVDQVLRQAAGRPNLVP